MHRLHRRITILLASHVLTFWSIAWADPRGPRLSTAWRWRVSRWRRTSSDLPGRWSYSGRRCRRTWPPTSPGQGPLGTPWPCNASLDPLVLLAVTINPEERVKVARGPAAAVLQQGGYTPVLVKVINEAATTKPLRITSPQSGLVVAGVADLSMKRQDQRFLKEGEVPGGRTGAVPPGRRW